MASKVSMTASAIERAYAYWIDKFLIYSLLLGIGWIAGWDGFTNMNEALESLMAATFYNIDAQNANSLFKYLIENPEIMSFFQLVSVAGIIYIVYSIAMEMSKYKATLGKFVVGIHVADNHGEDLSTGKIIGRNAIKLFIGKISGIVAFFMKDRKSLHDILTKSHVIMD